MIYEILYIIPSKFSDTEVDGVIEKVASIFSKHGAEIKQSKDLGKYKLAYPIKRTTHGHYVLVYAEIESDKLAEIETKLKLAEAVLRFTIVKHEEGIPSYEFNMISYEAPLTPEGKRISKKQKHGDKVQKPTTSKDSKKMSSKDLDKKLDEILESDIVADV